MAEVVNSIFKFTCSVLKIANKLMDSLSVLVLFLLSKININKARIGPYSVARVFLEVSRRRMTKVGKNTKGLDLFSRTLTRTPTRPIPKVRAKSFAACLARRATAQPRPSRITSSIRIWTPKRSIRAR